MFVIYNKIISRYHKIEYALTVIYGMNNYQVQKLCQNIGVNPQMRVHFLKSHHVNRIISYINNHKRLKFEIILKKKKRERSKELVNIKTTRGIRQSQGLPVRGQRTHTNAQTCKKFRKSYQKPNNQNKKKIKNNQSKNKTKKKNKK